MRTRLSGFVTILVCVIASACGTTSGGGGGSGAIYCGVGGTCPAGFACNANNFCIPSAADAGVTDSGGQDSAGGSDTGTTLPDTVKSDSGAQDTGTQDTGAQDTGPKDTGPADTGPQDTGPSVQTISAIEQAETSVNCATPDSIADSASDVMLESIVATSPAIKLKGSGGVYFTTFFAAPASGAASDGKWSGIQVVVNADPFPVNIGDTLTLKGTVKEFYCMTEITAKPEDVQITGNQGVPDDYAVQVSLFGSSAAEAYEGALITLTNVQVQDPNPLSTDGKTHGEVAINHNGGAVSVNFAPAAGSSYLIPGSATTGTTTTFTAGQGFASITGNLQWSFGHWVIRTRSDADISLK